jgi:hypothetical protein
MPLAQRRLYTSISIAPVIELKDVSNCKTDVYILVRAKQAGAVIKVRASSKAQFDKEFWHSIRLPEGINHQCLLPIA